MQLLLNPEAANFRADNVYKSGDLKLVGAEKFVKQGKVTYDDCTGGEGAGYAGGIMSAALDGYHVARAIIKKFKPIN